MLPPTHSNSPNVLVLLLLLSIPLPLHKGNFSLVLLLSPTVSQSLAGGGENKPIFIQALAQRRNYNSPVEAHGMLFPGGENFTNYSQSVSQPNCCCCCCSTTKRGRKTMNGIRAVQLRSAHRTRIGCHGGLCALTQRKFYYGWVSGESEGPGAEAFARSLARRCTTTTSLMFTAACPSLAG